MERASGVGFAALLAEVCDAGWLSGGKLSAFSIKQYMNVPLCLCVCIFAPAVCLHLI